MMKIIVFEGGGYPRGCPGGGAGGAGMSRNSRTREERRRARCLSVCRSVAAAVLVIMLMLLVLALDKPPERNRAAETAATVAAAQEYDRVMELWGDPVSAMEASNQGYEEAMLRWSE